MANKELELALRLKTDLEQGRREVVDLADAVDGVGTSAQDANRDLSKLGSGNDAGKAKTTVDGLTESVRQVGATAEASSTSLAQVGETAEQQATRIRAMVSASLQQQQANEQAAASTARLAGTVRQANEGWQETAAAQSAAMNTYHAAERAQEQRALAEQRAAEETAKAAAEADKQDASLRKLLGTIDRTEREFSQLDAQERELNMHFKAGRLDIDAYGRALDAIRNRRNALQGIGDEAKRTNLQLNSLTTTIRRVQGLLVTGFAGFGVTSASRAIINTNLEWQQTLSTLQAATGSSAQARQELEYVREVSERLGLELLNTSQAYARLVAAAKETPELGTAIRGIFEGVSSATTALNLTKEETNGILLALEQMVSKGKVQTQELVMQLGQRIPGAFALAAKALDTNTQQLSQWLEKGMIPASQFLPRFAAALQEAYGSSAQTAASGLNAEINRLNNTWTEFKIQAGEAGFVESYTSAIRDLQAVLRDPTITNGLNTLITAMGKLIEFSARGIGGATNFINWLGQETAARLGGPAGDDTVRVEQAIERQAEALADAQEAYFKAIDGGFPQHMVNRFEKRMQEAQTELQRLQQLQQTFSSTPPPSPRSAPSVTTPTPPGPFTPTGDDEAAKRLAKQQEDWVKQLEKEAATYGKGKAALREYELEQRNLSGALETRARAAWAVLDAAEKQKKADEQAKRDTQLLAQLQIDVMKATGQNVDAAAAEIEKKYGALRQRLQEAGNTDGANLVGQLIDIEQAQAQLDQLNQQLERIFAEQSRREQTISTQQQAGLVSELGARQQILDLNKATADQVDQLLPKMRELAAATGDPAALERVKDLETRLVALRTVANEFTNALKAGFETGIQSALKGLADGTMNLREAATSFISSIASSLTDLASKHLAQMFADGVGGLLNAGVDAASETAAATATATAITTASTAGATALGAGITTGGTTAASAMAAAISSAGASAAAAMASAIASAGAANSASNAASSFASVAAVAASTGGHITGPGTSTSDSIPAWLSNDEFVTRAAVVQQPGALNFLHAFNAKGLAALDDYAMQRWARHNTGGLAGVPAPAMASPQLPSGGKLAEPAKSMSTTVANAVNLHVYDDPQRIAEGAFNTRAGEEAYALMLSRDPQRWRGILQL